MRFRVPAYMLKRTSIMGIFDGKKAESKKAMQATFIIVGKLFKM